jgi:hypothetical protein
MTTDDCPLCGSSNVHPLTRWEGNQDDRGCQDCGFRWPVWVPVRPGEHHVDVSAIVARMVKQALALKERDQ